MWPLRQPRRRSRHTRRPMLLALVFGVFLVLIGVTATALVTVTATHLSSATVNAVVDRDRALVALFVNSNVRRDDVDAQRTNPRGGRRPWRSKLATLDCRGRDSPDRSARDRTAPSWPARRRACAATDPARPRRCRPRSTGQPVVDLVAGSEATDAGSSGFDAEQVVQEFLPLLSEDRRAYRGGRDLAGCRPAPGQPRRSSAATSSSSPSARRSSWR